MTATAEEIKAAFTQWESDYRANPEKFMSDMERYTKQTPNTYGALCAVTLAACIEKGRNK